MRQARREEGWALVSALWTLTMLALLAAAAETLTVTSYRIEQRALAEARAQAVLDAAVVRAVLGLSEKRPDKRWRVDGTQTSFFFDGTKVDVSVQDELGRIDLNAASGAMIGQLLAGLGVPPDIAGTLTDRIIDWRSATGLATLHGGTDGDYRAAGLSYRPRHGPFQSVDELKLVLGMTPQLFAKVRPALTVYSKHAMFDPAVAPREALLALYREEEIERMLQARGGDPNVTMRLGILPGTVSDPNALAGRAFAISALVRTGNRSFARNAVVEITGDDALPYYVLMWQ
jgi:general secretion pathway protein K